MKIYLCGPVSLGGTLNEEQIKENLQRFHDTEAELAAAGYVVENPANIHKHVVINALPLPDHNAGRSWEWYMRRTLIQMLLCEAVVVLPGYDQSPGCTLELVNAVKLGLPVYSWIAQTFQPLAYVSAAYGAEA